MASREVLMKTGLRPLNNARTINTAHPKTTVYSARPMPKAVNTARPNSVVVNVVRKNQVNVVKASACWVWKPTKLNSASITLKRHNYVNARGKSNGYSRHMTGNMSYLSDFKDFDRGCVTFGGGAKEGKLLVKELLKLVQKKVLVQNASNDEPQPPSNARKKDDEGVCKESEIDDQERPKNSTQDVNTIGPSINTEPNMFSLGNNATLEATHADVFGDETEVYMSNITTTYLVSSTPNARIHKGHSLDHVIGDVHSGEEPKRIAKALSDSAWVEAMPEELLQFKLQKVWVLVDLSKARIKAIRLFLAYASFMGFMMYQMDVKSAFLYGRIEEEVYVDDIIFGSTKKELCIEFEKLMHDKFQMNVRTASTPMDTKKHLLKDLNGDDVDVHLYRSMIGSLMYLTSSRPDIMFAVCACARFQVTPKVSHLHVVKRIFRYLKGQPKLSLWYPKDSPFDLVAYSDSDYARASLDRKSITGGCQFQGCRLISWQCKKQTLVATSSTKAEYMAAAS
ncbi:uncharacterized mitochondrial protein-like protein [Tanacetum coccineum]